MGIRPNQSGNRPRPRNKSVLRRAARVLPRTVVEKLLRLKIARQKAAKKRKTARERQEYLKRLEETEFHDR